MGLFQSSVPKTKERPLNQLLATAKTVSSTPLEYAHQQNSSVIHRDIKPANVMVTSHGTVKVVDFGIARPRRRFAFTNRQMIGTLAYMSPQDLVFVVHFSLSQETATFLRSHNKLVRESVHNWVNKAVLFCELLDV
jgi:serine/threonine protein kinase